MLKINSKFRITNSIDCIQINIHTHKVLSNTNKFNNNFEENGFVYENYVFLDSFLGSVHSFFRTKNIQIEKTIFEKNYQSILIFSNNVNINKVKTNSELILIKNFLKTKMLGITTGFVSYIQLKGLGFRSQIKGTKLLLKVGLTDLIYFDLPSTIRVKRIKKHTLKIYGIDLEVFRNTSIRIKVIREPSPYNDRGLVFKDEVRKLKQGKRSKF